MNFHRSPGRAELRPADKGHGDKGRALRRVLLALLLAGLAAPPPAGAAQKVRLVLNWLPGGVHVPLFYGRETGIYRKKGIEVSIRSARGSRLALKKMLNGGAEFALAESTELFEHRANGFDTVGLLVYLDQSPNAIISLRKATDKKFSHLSGKRIGAPRASFPRILFPYLKKAGKIRLDTIRWVNLAPDELLPSLMSNRVDAVAASTLVAFQYRDAAKQAGKKLDVFPYAELGLNPYSLALVSMDSLIAQKEEVVRAFVEATAQALAASVEHPRAALKAFLKRNPALGAERIGAEWRAALDLIDTPQARRGGLGRFQEKRMVKMRALIERTRRFKLNVPLTSLYNNEFVPDLKPRRGAL